VAWRGKLPMPRDVLNSTTKENIMAHFAGKLNLDECPDFSLFEQADDTLSTMAAIRAKMLVAEENKPNPDEALIAQWDADFETFREEDRNVQVANRDWNIQIIMKYTPEIRAWYGADGQEPVYKNYQLEDAEAEDEGLRVG
jgi:hypothetical protein